jgi:phosphoribosylformimino-5-aminoimidazole carboxamide ribonucleotide (ProFAR) isomerase
MIVIPAIDIRAGKVVRLRQGQVESESVYGSDPVAAARRWQSEGAPAFTSSISTPPSMDGRSSTRWRP